MLIWSIASGDTIEDYPTPTDKEITGPGQLEFRVLGPWLGYFMVLNAEAHKGYIRQA